MDDISFLNLIIVFSLQFLLTVQKLTDNKENWMVLLISFGWHVWNEFELIAYAYQTIAYGY